MRPATDLDTATLLAAISTEQMGAWEYLTSRWPARVVEAAIEREIAAGHLEYGSAVRRPWLTIKGVIALTTPEERK